MWLLIFSVAITWVFAKSIANAADLAKAFGPIGGVGYATYYLSFFVAAGAIYFIPSAWRAPIAARVPGRPLWAALRALVPNRHLDPPVQRGVVEHQARGTLFRAEGEATYWLAVVLITAFTIAYSWRGGLRSSLLTDAGRCFWRPSC